MTDYGNDLAQQGFHIISFPIYVSNSEVYFSAGKCLHVCQETSASTDKQSGAIDQESFKLKLSINLGSGYARTYENCVPHMCDIIYILFANLVPQLCYFENGNWLLD